MRRIKLVGMFAGVLAVAFLLSHFDTASAQKTKGKTRAAATKYLMRGIVQPNCAGIGALLKGDGPKDEKAWDTVACHAACLNEMSYALMDDGRCPDAVWAKAAKETLRECSSAVLKAAEKQDVEETRTAFKALTAACASCHKAHKGK